MLYFGVDHDSSKNETLSQHSSKNRMTPVTNSGVSEGRWGRPALGDTFMGRQNQSQIEKLFSFSLCSAVCS